MENISNAMRFEFRMPASVPGVRKSIYPRIAHVRELTSAGAEGAEGVDAEAICRSAERSFPSDSLERSTTEMRSWGFQLE